MPSTYEFSSVSEFVAYLDMQAKDATGHASEHSPRSHLHASFSAEATAYQRIANMVRHSNLVAVTDYEKAAQIGGVA